jgi:hypothetical protein
MDLGNRNLVSSCSVASAAPNCYHRTPKRSRPKSHRSRTFAAKPEGLRLREQKSTERALQRRTTPDACAPWFPKAAAFGRSFPYFCRHRNMAAGGNGSYFYRKTFGKTYCGSQSSVGEADSDRAGIPLRYSFSKEPVACGRDESSRISIDKITLQAFSVRLQGV